MSFFCLTKYDPIIEDQHTTEGLHAHPDVVVIFERRERIGLTANDHKTNSDGMEKVRNVNEFRCL